MSQGEFDRLELMQQLDRRAIRQANAAKRTRINAPSYHQVTEPIYTRARFRWERYKDQLAPVMGTLEKWAEIWGY